MLVVRTSVFCYSKQILPHNISSQCFQQVFKLSFLIIFCNMVCLNLTINNTANTDGSQLTISTLYPRTSLLRKKSVSEGPGFIPQNPLFFFLRFMFIIFNPKTIFFKEKNQAVCWACCWILQIVNCELVQHVLCPSSLL